MKKMMTKEDIQDIVGAAKDQVNLANIKEYVVQNDHCIVAPVEFKDLMKQTTGVINPSQYEDKNEYGVILATGPGRRADYADFRHVPEFKVGDVVLYGQYSYTQLRVNGFDLNLIRHDDIIAILPKR